MEWFFKEYLKDELSVPNFEVYFPKKDNTYFEKFRKILPEMDRYFTYWNLFTDYGSIDQEMIKLSTFSYMTKQIKTLNSKKYVYPTDT